MTDKLNVRGADYTTDCKLKGEATVTPTGMELMTIGSVPSNKQPNFSVTPRTSPVDGGDPKLVVSLDWENARLDIRENLLSRLLQAIEDSVMALGTASVGRLREAIEKIAEAIRSIFSESRIRFDYSFIYTVKIEGSGPHTLLVEHAQRKAFQSSQTFPGGPRTNSVVDVRLAAGGKVEDLDLFFLRRPRPRQEKDIPNSDYEFTTVTAFSTLPLSFKAGLEVYFAGFGDLFDIDKILKRLNEIIKAAADLADDSFAAAKQLIKNAARDLGFDDEEDVDELKKSTLAENLKKLAKLSLTGLIDLLKTAINKFIEQIRLDENIVTIHCIKAEALSNYVLSDGGGKKEAVTGDPGSTIPVPPKTTPVPVPQDSSSVTKPSDGGEKNDENETVAPTRPDLVPAGPRIEKRTIPGSFEIDPDIVLVTVTRNLLPRADELREIEFLLNRRSPRLDERTIEVDSIVNGTDLSVR